MVDTMPTFNAGSPLPAGDLNMMARAIDAAGIVGAAMWNGGFSPTTTGAEVALASWTATQLWTFRDGHVYAMHCQCSAYNNNASINVANQVRIRLRKATNSIVAQLLGNTEMVTHGTTVSGAVQHSWTSYIVNSTGADLTGVDIGMTIQRASGADGNALYGDGIFPLSIVGEEVGLASNVPNIVSMSASIT